MKEKARKLQKELPDENNLKNPLHHNLKTIPLERFRKKTVMIIRVYRSLLIVNLRDLRIREMEEI